MKKKQKLVKGKKIKMVQGGDPSMYTNFDSNGNPMGSVPQVNSMMSVQDNEMLTNDSVPPPQPNPNPSVDLSGQNAVAVHPSMQDTRFNNANSHSDMNFQLIEPQPVAGTQQPRKPLVGFSGKWNPQGGVNTTDVFAGAEAITAGLLPYKKPKQNNNQYVDAMQTNKYGTGSQATYKKGGKIKKADAGAQLTPQQMDNYNQFHTQEYQKYGQNFGGDTYNHNGYANADLTQWNQRHPGQPIDLASIQAAPNSIDPLGKSPQDMKVGPQTMAKNFMNYDYLHLDSKGNKQPDSKYFGTDKAGAYAAVSAHPSQAIPQNPHSNPYMTPTQPSVNYREGTMSDYDKGQQPMAMNKPKGMKQKANFHTGEDTNYSIDAVRTAAMGATIPFTEGGNVQVDNNQFEMVSPNTALIKGQPHSNGGTDIAANGTQVEAEKGETLHIDNQSNTIVGGNMYIPHTNTKYKDGFKAIAKIEKKNDKTKDKVIKLSEHVDNYQDRYQAPIAGTIKVMADAHSQISAKTDAVKQHLTDMQNQQLAMKEQQKVARKGKKMADGGTVADWFSGDDRITPVQKKQIANHPQVKKSIAKAKQDIQQGKTTIRPTAAGSPAPIQVPQNYWDSNGIPQPREVPMPNANTPRNPEYIAPLDTSGPQLMPVGDPMKDSQQQLQEQANSTAYIPAVNDVKKQAKGVRNKFRPLDYLSEFSALLDKPEPVPSVQSKAILEPEYNVSLQAKKNSIISAYRPALNAAKNSPAQQAAISADMAEKLGNVDSEELQYNQQNTGGIRGRNLQEIRGVRDTNLKLQDEALYKTQLAKANTEQNRYNAVRSVEGKEAQRRFSNNQLGMEEQMIGYAWDPQHGYTRIAPDYQFSDIGLKQPVLDDTNIKKKKKSTPKGPETSEEESYVAAMGGSMGGIPGGFIATRKEGTYKKKKQSKSSYV